MAIESMPIDYSEFKIQTSYTRQSTWASCSLYCQSTGVFSGSRFTLLSFFGSELYARVTTGWIDCRVLLVTSERSCYVA